MSKEDSCSYCHKPLVAPYSFSYGMPGIKQVFKCSRWWCTLKLKFVKKPLGKFEARVVRLMREIIKNHG